MANQLSATVYQIDGNPQRQPITVSFLTNNIFIKEATISTNPAVQSAITYYPNTSNQLEAQTFYVSEDIDALFTDVNPGVSSMVQVTVLDINGDPQPSGGVKYCFPVLGISIWENVVGDINSIVQFKNKKYGVLETESFLVSIANAYSEGPQGPQGIQGPVGPEGPIGPVGPAGLNWQGAWSDSETYVVDDAVGYDGASWFCIDNVGPSVTPPDVDTTNWALLASQGAQGPIGATGAQGPTGPQGPQGSSNISTLGTSLYSTNPSAGPGFSQSNGIFLGNQAGSGATTAYNSNFLGIASGRNAADANSSNFFGNAAGENATSANDSNFSGVLAGYAASNANNSNFFGFFAGRQAVNASNSNFFGNTAGQNASSANNSNFFGSGAGKNSFGNNVNAFGVNAGLGNSINGMTIFSNASLPSFPDHATAAAAITVPNGASANCTYLYHNQATNSIGAVKL
jgi:hypothetical protein